MKSNGPLKYSQADIFGLIVACHSKLTVNLAWGKRRSRRYGGNVASTPARMERKWFLKCGIIHSALFLECMSHGTSWTLVFHDSVMTCLKSALASISDIEIHQKLVSSQLRHEGVEGRNAEFVCFCLESLL